MTQTEEQFAESLFHRYPSVRGKIRIKFPVFTGRSGSSVWQIEIDPTKDHRGGAAFAKVDAQTRCHKERDRHANAREHPRMTTYIPDILFPITSRQEIVDEGRTFVIYQSAHNMVRTLALSNVLRGTRYSIRDETSIIQNLVTPVLNTWYEGLSNISDPHPFDLSAEFTRLFDLGEEDIAAKDRRSAGLAARMKENFGIEGLPQKLIFNPPQIDAVSLPNPMAVLAHLAELPAAQRILNLPSVPMHGDLHTGNVICRLSERGSLDIEAAPALIDFAQYEEVGFPFFDLAYLELSVLEDAMLASATDDWSEQHTLLTFLTESILPQDKPEGRLPDEAWQLISPIRTYVSKIIDNVASRGPGIQERYETAWWFAAAVAGLRFARRSTSATSGQRSVALFYAGAAAKHLQRLLAIPQPAYESRVLLDWDEGRGFFAQGAAALAPKPAAVTRRSGLPLPPEFFIVHPYTPTVFIGRQSELDELTAWVQSNDPIMVVEAIGGQGKSALTWHWLHNQAQEDRPQLAGALWWSFYESDGAMDNFISHALAYVTDTPLDEVKKQAREERERALIAALKERTFLLVMDGLERILHAYYTVKASHLTDEEIEQIRQRGEDADRICANKLDGRFLELLLSIQPSKILVSTRLLPTHFEDRAGRLRSGVQRKLLDGLSPNDALTLMRHYGIKGDGNKIKDFTRQFGNHGLLLGVIAGQINDYRPAPGNFEAWYKTRGRDLKLSDLDIRQRQTHILEFAMRNLPDEVLQLLEQIAVFRYPINYEILAYINPFAKHYYVALPPITEEQIKKHRAKQTEYRIANDEWYKTEADSDEEREWEEKRQSLYQILRAFEKEQASAKQFAWEQARRRAEPDLDKALHKLEDRGLILSDIKANVYDLHPVVRAYTYERLSPSQLNEMLEGKKTVFDSQTQTDMSQVMEVHQLRRELEIYHALVASQKWDLAWSFYSNALLEVLLFQLDAYYEIVELLSPLFEDNESLPRLSSYERRSAYLTHLAAGLREIDPQKSRHIRGIALRMDVEAKSVDDLARDLRNFSIFSSGQNRFYDALWIIETVLGIALSTDSDSILSHCHRIILSCSVQIGHWEKAETSYRAFNPAGLSWPDIWQSEVELAYAQMLLIQARPRVEIENQLRKAQHLAETARHAESLRNVQNLYGEAALLQGDGISAEQYFQEHERLCLKVRLSAAAALGGQARALILQERYDSARLLAEGDIDAVSAAEVWLALGETEKAKEAALIAYRKAWGQGQPYVDWWPFQRATKVLEALDVSLPDMPAFDPDKRERLPYEDEIIAFIETLEAALPKEKKPSPFGLPKKLEQEDKGKTRSPADLVFPPRGTPQPVRERWALLVGANKYADPNLGSLKYCANDVQRLGQDLEKKQFTTLVLHDQDQREDAKRPTSDNVHKMLEFLRERVHPDDLLWLHFSCHGEVIDGEPMLIFANTRQRTHPSVLRVRDLETMFRDFKRVLVTLDACHVGIESGRGSDDAEFIRHVNEMAENFAVLAASTSQQRAAEWQDQSMGVFSYYLWEGIQGWADRNQRGYITVTDLASHVLNGVRRWSFRQGGILQDPTYSIRGIGDMIVIDQRKNMS